MSFTETLSGWFGITELRQLQEEKAAAAPRKVFVQKWKIVLAGLVTAGVVAGGVFIAPVVAASSIVSTIAIWTTAAVTAAKALSLTAALTIGGAVLGTVAAVFAVFKGGIKVYKYCKANRTNEKLLSLCIKILKCDENNEDGTKDETKDKTKDKTISAIADDLVEENPEVAKNVLNQINSYAPNNSSVLPEIKNSVLRKETTSILIEMLNDKEKRDTLKNSITGSLESHNVKQP